MTYPVFTKLAREFIHTKKQLLFLVICFAAVGCVLPLFIRDFRTLTMTTMSVAILFLNFALAGLYAEEKEKRTIETLLSSPVSIQNLIYAAFFCYFPAIFLFSFLTLGMQTIVVFLLYHTLPAGGYFLMFMGLLYVLVLAFLVYTGITVSLLASNVIQASKRMSARSFGNLILFSAGIILMESGNALAFYVVMVPYAFFAAVLLVYKIATQKKHITVEKVFWGTQKNRPQGHIHMEDSAGKKNVTGVIFRHEVLLAKTYSLLTLHMVLMLFIPSALLYGIKLVPEYGQQGLFTWPIACALLLVLRVPTNFISISIGGEKAYKTFESLLSTPAPLNQIFIGKIMPSVLLSSIILFISSLGTLLTANILRLLEGTPFTFINYSLFEWIMIVGAGLQLTILMVFITGYLSLTSKSPRAGLWVASFATLVLGAPYILVLVFARGNILASLLFTISLLLLNALCFLIVLKKIDRKVLLEKI